MAKQLVLSRSSNEPIYSISCSESEEWSAINLHPQLPKRIVVKCSGDGLVCFWNSSYVIWNPSTDRYQSIPRNDSTNIPCICPSRECFREASGFVDGIGFVPESHDYKLVTFISCHYCDDDSDDDEDDLFEHHGSDHVAVYLSKTNSWKELPFPFHFEDISPVYFATPTCVNGFIYWITQRNVILSFDLSSDKFSTILCPDDIPPDFRWTYSIYDIPPGFCHKEKAHLLDFDGSLCFVIQFQSEEKATTKTLSFWVYAASSSSSPSPWTRKINLDVRLDTALADIPLWLGKKNINGGEFLMLQGVDGSVLEYDYTTRELKRIDLISTYPKQCFVPNNVMVSSYVATSANIAMTKHVNANIVDRISQLPDDLILCILSFLSLKEAASTSVLSTRWSALWKHTPNLNFHVTNVNNKYIKWVNSVVESHKALSLKEFSISFPNYEPTSSTIMKWLEFAFSRRVEVLELNFCGRTFGFLQEFLQKSTMTNLTSLCLKCLKVSGSDIGLFLRNCPLLERLIIKSAVLTSDLEVCSSALKHLDIQHCEGGKSIKGYAPNLTSLKIDSAPFSLHKADDHLNLAWESPLFPFISPLLTTLEFTLHFPPKGFGNRFPLVTTLKELILTYLGGLYIRLITCLLCAFPYLEEFEIKCFRRVQKHARSPVEGQGMDVVRFCHCHLRVFKFTWFDVGDAEHIKLMSCILDNCVGLQKIILDIYDVDSLTYVAAGEYAKQLQSKLPTHIQLIVSFNNRHLV